MTLPPTTAELEVAGQQKPIDSMTPLKQKIINALAASPQLKMSYYSLACKLWPPKKSPKAWRYSSNGGPPVWAMPLGKALRDLREAGLLYQRSPMGGGAGRGDVVLLSAALRRAGQGGRTQQSVGAAR